VLCPVDVSCEAPEVTGRGVTGATPNGLTHSRGPFWEEWEA